jgi:hypothetical protein
MSDKRGERVRRGKRRVGLGAGHTRDARGIVGAKTLALMNTPAEPAPTEDTCAVTQEQASLREQLARSNPHCGPRTRSFVADASNHSVRCSAAPSSTRMQVRAFETKMTATRWQDADDEEDPVLPRMPWRTAAGSAWPCK